MHQVSRTVDSITLSWSQPDQPNGVILDYELQYYEKDHSELNSTVIRSPTNTVVIRGLKQGTIYVFQVRARTVAGFGRYSGKLYFQTMTEAGSSLLQLDPHSRSWILAPLSGSLLHWILAPVAGSSLLQLDPHPAAGSLLPYLDPCSSNWILAPVAGSLLL
ncbi:Ephrin type-B receptor 2 [Takifugu flavidus]|uniref:Ephrin type-B receptor 2 n=1 Tax=Takifugu flavidus TaxID=433684 RepID=A0A5C6N7B7_9TELE|nr:Ephrin type-B receptor 2 [Takifugu flavidus]